MAGMTKIFDSSSLLDQMKTLGYITGKWHIVKRQKQIAISRKLPKQIYNNKKDTKKVVELLVNITLKLWRIMNNLKTSIFKLILERDPETRFLTSVFFIKQLPLGLWYTHGLKHFWIWLRICGVNRQSWLHSGVIDTAVTLDLIFEWLWLPLKGISIEKTYIGKLAYTISITFTQKYGV
jgi:hypothetical protein